ncbi:hypothetical protein ACFE04_017089 [Oxalis oulophora]
MDPQAKNVITSPEADDEGDSIQNKGSVKYLWPLKHRRVEFNNVEREYKRLEEERRHFAENIEKIRKIQPIISNWKYWKWHPRMHQREIKDILAWKNDILIVALEALNASNSNKQSHNLQILLRHSKRSLKSERKIVKDQVSKSGAREQPRNNDAIRNSSGTHEKPRSESDDAFRDAIRALNEPKYTIQYFEELVRCHCWRGCIERFIPPHIRTEIEDIKTNRNKWLVERYSYNYWKVHVQQPNEEQLKKLLQETIRLMCIIRQVTEKLLVDVVHENKKYVNNENEKLITSLERKLANLKLRKAEVGKFMSNWKNGKISIDDYQIIKTTSIITTY